ncbi:MAG: hypothetical protein GOVbin4551_5 [Prokaryotic dsDNA virus sp.]|nr:MAG: hypothetical protein GOVbin4551_5 [Prokaryotic dsDNA virus sp.]|tara:strand:- start:3002 stop:3964 length:963 start_codon:yes stop_codon:yes gene_type:complete
MTVPKQALAQLETVEKALEETQNVIPEDTSMPVDETPTIESNVANVADGQGLNSETSPVIEELQKSLELEKQRTASLKGRIDSQLKQTNSENKELKNKLNEMMTQFKEMKKANSTPGFKRNLSEEEIQDVGEDVLKLQERVIKGTLEEELENGSIKELVEGLVKQSLSAEQKQIKPSIDQNWFWSQVDKFYPGAKDINTSDNNWFLFLEKFDSISGQQYREVGNNAIQNGDVPALVDLLTLYKPLPKVEAVHTEEMPLHPETTASASGINKQTKPEKVFTQAEVSKFYQDKVTGGFKGSNKEWLKLEEEIMEAAASGRIL